MKENIFHVDEILTSLSKAPLNNKMNTCTFFRDKIGYLCHVIGLGKLEIVDVYTASIRKSKHLTINNELHSFFRLGNVCRQFIP